MYEGDDENTHVHYPTVDVTELLEAKQPRTVCRVIEREGLDRQ